MLYNGYTYDEKDLSARAERMFSAMATNFVLSHTTEQDADDLAALVDVVLSSEPLEGCGNDSDLYDWARGG